MTNKKPYWIALVLVGLALAYQIWNDNHTEEALKNGQIVVGRVIAIEMMTKSDRDAKVEYSYSGNIYTN